MAKLALKKVKQLGISIHTTKPTETSSWPTVEQLVREGTVLAELEALGLLNWRSYMDRWGMQVSRHYNDTYVSSAYEMAYINTYYISADRWVHIAIDATLHG